MGLLEELKQQAEQHKKLRLSEERCCTQREVRYRELIIPRIKEIHAYLRELVDYMNIAEIKIQAAYTIPHGVRFTNFFQQDYQIHIDNIDAPNWISLSFFCRADKPLIFSISPRETAEHTASLLREHGIQFTESALHSGSHRNAGINFEVRPNIPVQFRIEADKDAGLIRVNSRNFEDLSLRYDRFDPEKIDSDWKDNLGRYLLRYDNTYRSSSISELERQAIRQALDDYHRRLQPDSR